MMKLFSTEDCHYGFYDEKMEVAIPPIYDYALPFSEGKAVVCTGGRMGQGKTGFIDEYGKICIPMIYDGARSFSEGLAQVELVQDGKRMTGFINHNGEIAIPLNYNFAMSFHNGVAPVCIGESWVTGRFGCIDIKGNIVVPMQYDYLEPFSTSSLFKVRKNGKWGLVDSSNKLIIPICFSEKEIPNMLIGLKIH